MPYHRQIDVRPSLPSPWASDGIWVKGDMLYAVSYARLDFFRMKSADGLHTYVVPSLTAAQMAEVRRCILESLGLSILTKYV